MCAKKIGANYKDHRFQSDWSFLSWMKYPRDVGMAHANTNYIKYFGFSCFNVLTWYKFVSVRHTLANFTRFTWNKFIFWWLGPNAFFFYWCSYYWCKSVWITRLTCYDNKIRQNNKPKAVKSVENTCTKWKKKIYEFEWKLITSIIVFLLHTSHLTSILVNQ